MNLFPDPTTEQADILKVSRGVSFFSFSHRCPDLSLFIFQGCHCPTVQCAILLLTRFYQLIDLPCVVYLSYLVFQLFSHKNLYDDTDVNAKPATVHYPKKEKSPQPEPSHSSSSDVEAGPVDPINPPEEAEEKPQLSVVVTVILLASVTVFVAVTAEWLVDSINGLASSGSISKEFIGLILLPIVGNAAEHVTAVTVSVKDKLTLSLGVAVGSSIVSIPCASTLPQSRLTVSCSVPIKANRAICRSVSSHFSSIANSYSHPVFFYISTSFIVILGWILQKPMSLLFDPFESIVLFLSGESAMSPSSERLILTVVLSSDHC
jgi:Ca2+:H+ antiporter